MLDSSYDADIASLVERSRADLNDLRLTGEMQGIELAKLYNVVHQSIVGAQRFQGASGAIIKQAENDIINELLFLGPLEELLEDPEITEIMVNGPEKIWVEEQGKISLAPVHFRDDEQIKLVIRRLAEEDNKRCDESSPLLDAILHRPAKPFDGSRINAVMPLVAVDHPCLTIRKFRRDAMTPKDLIARGSFDARVGLFLRSLVLGRMNIIIAGGTGTGKTTLLNALALFIPDDQRIITIEDTPELYINQPDVVRMQTRPPNSEGGGSIVIRDLLINSLRMRPDRIIVGECRGPEAFEMLQAMSTGHDGSLSTIHASSSREVITRLQSMVQMSQGEMGVDAIREFIAGAVDFIIVVGRFADGSRRIVEVCEVCGMQASTVTLAPIMRFQQRTAEDGSDASGFIPTGELPTPNHSERMKFQGVELDRRLFLV